MNGDKRTEDTVGVLYWVLGFRIRKGRWTLTHTRVQSEGRRRRSWPADLPDEGVFVHLEITDVGKGFRVLSVILIIINYIANKKFFLFLFVILVLQFGGWWVARGMEWEILMLIPSEPGRCDHVPHLVIHVTSRAVLHGRVRCSRAARLVCGRQRWPTQDNIIIMLHVMVMDGIGGAFVELNFFSF